MRCRRAELANLLFPILFPRRCLWSNPCRAAASRTILSANAVPLRLADSPLARAVMLRRGPRKPNCHCLAPIAQDKLLFKTDPLMPPRKPPSLSSGCLRPPRSAASPTILAPNRFAAAAVLCQQNILCQNRGRAACQCPRAKTTLPQAELLSFHNLVQTRGRIVVVFLGDLAYLNAHGISGNVKRYSC